MKIKFQTEQRTDQCWAGRVSFIKLLWVFEEENRSCSFSSFAGPCVVCISNEPWPWQLFAAL